MPDDDNAAPPANPGSFLSPASQSSSVPITAKQDHEISHIRSAHHPHRPNVASTSSAENIPLRQMSRQRLPASKPLISEQENDDHRQQDHSERHGKSDDDEDANVPKPKSLLDETVNPSSSTSRDKGKGKQDENDSRSWFTKTIRRFGTLHLENKGSVARDHLALERTFLAWLRTSLSFASIGIAVTQLFRLNSTLASGNPAADHVTTLRHMGKPLGATFLGIAILVLMIGLNRYYESQNWLLHGKFPASRGSILLVTFVAAALIITSLVIIVTVNPSVTKT